MLERPIHLRCVMCVLWFAVATAAGQSNQPIEIGSTHLVVDSASPTKQPVVALPPQPPDDAPVQRRLEKIAHQLAAASPTAAAVPHGVAEPETNQKEVVQAPALPGLAGPLQTPVDATINPIEQRRLGSPVDAPVKSDSGDKTQTIGGRKWIVQTAGALGLVLGVILLARAVLNRLLRRQAVSGANGLLEVLGRVNVGGRQQVLLIRTGKRVLVVGDGASGLRTLADIDEPEEVAGLLAAVAADRPNSVSRSFNQLLTRFNGDYGEHQRRVEEGRDVGEYRVDRARDQVSNLVSRIRSLNTAKKEQWA